MLEFTLVGIGIIFVFISFFEIARGLWTYQTLAYAVREGTRYATVHGKDCASPNTCQVTIGQITSVIKSAGPGLDPDQTTVTFTPANGSATSDTITNLLSNTTTWPPSTAYTPGQNVEISMVYPFRTILAMFWVGAGRPIKDSQVFHLAASSTEAIQY
ncbi:MAG TPA: TadE family protein [Bryobacteraceae bacterium]|nr:TadE family protein [Bryobacteraceae bacterium]